MLGQPSEPKSCSVAVRLHDFAFEEESCPCITASPSAGMQRGSSARPDVHGFHGSVPPFLGPSLPSCCHLAVHAVTKAMAIQSHNLFQPVFAFMHHFELYFSWRLVVQLSPSCTAALSSALFLGSFAAKSLSHGSHGKAFSMAMARQVSVARFGCPQQPMTRQPSQECAARHCGARRGVKCHESEQ